MNKKNLKKGEEARIVPPGERFCVGGVWYSAGQKLPAEAKAEAEESREGEPETTNEEKENQQ